MQKILHEDQNSCLPMAQPADMWLQAVRVWQSSLGPVDSSTEDET